MSAKNILASSILNTEEFKEVLELFFNALPDPIYVIDQNGLIIKELGRNDNALSAGNEPLEGHNLSTILPVKLTDLFMNTINKSIDDNALTCIDYAITQNNNELEINQHWYQGRVFPLKQRNNDIRAVLWVAINITQTKHLEFKLKNLAEKDELTRLYNRRYFTQIIQRSFSLYQRDNSSFCILMLDIDFFKVVNDNFGHDGGDQLLINLAQVFKESIRDIDLLARYGGEEFIVLLPNTTKNTAFIVAERVRLATEKFSLCHHQHIIKATVSIGIGEVNLNDTSHEQTIKRADISLYQAKKKGRNQVCFDSH